LYTSGCCALNASKPGRLASSAGQNSMRTCMCCGIGGGVSREHEEGCQSVGCKRLHPKVNAVYNGNPEQLHVSNIIKLGPMPLHQLYTW
jgi:hypothetical protein